MQAIADGGSSGAALAVQELVRGNGKIFLVSGAGCLVGVHSGPDTHDHPQVIIHAPNDPFGHTDQMWGEHGDWCNVLLGDGSVRFVTAFVDLNAWVALSTRDGGEVVGDY